MINALILFLAPLISGLLVYVLPQGKVAHYRLLLVFAGSYLFSITVSHILPELYRQHQDVHLVGLFVLAGFFLQLVLEYFTSGIEHGHLHGSKKQHDHSHHNSAHVTLSAGFLLVALCLHAFLEGAMLAQPNTGQSVYNVKAVIAGIVLHRAPAAFALMTVLFFELGSRKKALPYLVIFSIAAPAGLLLSNTLTKHNVLGEEGLIFLYALVCGNFLHISTTIVLESSPDHKFNPKKLAWGILGALMAVVTEMFI